MACISNLTLILWCRCCWYDLLEIPMSPFLKLQGFTSKRNTSWLDPNFELDCCFLVQVTPTSIRTSCWTSKWTKMNQEQNYQITHHNLKAMRRMTCIIFFLILANYPKHIKWPPMRPKNLIPKRRANFKIPAVLFFFIIQYKQSIDRRRWRV
jgi:hypothetical protein